MLEFLKKLKELIGEQEREAERAIIGRDKYELRPQYQSFQVPEGKWFAMSLSQRDQYLKIFSIATVSDATCSADLQQNSGGKLPDYLGRDLTVASSLTVDVKAVADSVRIPLNCLEGIWSKASELLKTPDAIVSAPGVGVDAKFVLSYSGKKPHLVIPKRGGTKGRIVLGNENLHRQYRLYSAILAWLKFLILMYKRI